MKLYKYDLVWNNYFYITRKINMKNLILFISIFCVSAVIDAQIPGEIYFNYDELTGIKVESESTLSIHYNLNGKQDAQQTNFTKTQDGIKLGKLKSNANPTVKKLSSESLEFKDGNFYLPKYRMFFYSDQNRKIMENQDCYIVNNEIFFAPKGKVKGKLKKKIKNLRKESIQAMILDSKTTYDKYGIHCLGATEILGIPQN